eukprot:scaffold10205_cov52-Cyclotella_meneghiniana.AAC.4
MAETDRIKALAGLLDDDDDDDLFASSSNEGDVDSAIAPSSSGGHASSTYLPSNMPVKQSKKTTSANENQLRHGVVTNQQQDNILMEMRQKKLVTRQNKESSGQKKNNVTASPVPTMSPNRPKLGQPRLTLTIETDVSPEDEITDESSSPENDGDGLIFGRPKTFGAAGGYSDTYMPNVKERASAISTWKILEMKKERKNGHARAREWAVREEGIDDHGYEEPEGHDENVASNGQHEEKVIVNKGKIPSFLAQFDDVDVENECENSVNGVACSLTPRSSEKRVPLSPRSMNGHDVVLSPRNWVSPRNIGVGPARRVSPGSIGVSPINVLSPRSSAGGRRSMDGKLKVNASAASPRNKVFSGRDQVLSPRSNALLSPSRAVNRSINQVKLGVPSKVTATHKPPMSPRGFRSNVNPTPKKRNDENGEKETRKHATPPVKFNGVEVMGELAAALERRLAKSGVPESPIAKEVVRNDQHMTLSREEPEKSGNGEVVTMNQTETHGVKGERANQASTKRVTFNHGQAVEDIGELTSNLERQIAGGCVPESEVMGELAYTLEYQHIKGGAIESNGVDIEHDGVSLSESGVICQHKSNNNQAHEEQELKVPVNRCDEAMPRDKTLQDTLDEVSSFLQTWDIEEQQGDSGSIESKIDDELSAAAELAHALDKFLVVPVSSIEDKKDRAQSGDKVFLNEMGVDAATDYVDERQAPNCGPHSHSKRDDVSRSAHLDVQIQSRDLNDWNKVKQDISNDSLGFSSDFKGLLSSHFNAADIHKSNDGNDLFVDAFQSLQFVPKKSDGKNAYTESKAGEKNLTKIKVNLKIEGAPQLDIDKNADEESMFYVSQPSPSCRDDAGLLQTQHSSGSPQTFESPAPFDPAPKKRGVALNSPTKRRLNNLGLKLGLISAGPSKNDLESPSMDSLLKSGEDENIGMVSNGQLRQLTPSNQETGQFFASPPSPIMHGTLMPESPTKNKTETSQADFGASRKKITNRVLKRITTPLKLGRRMGRAEVNDEVFYGEV